MATILVLDDDPAVRELCAVVLRGEGFDVLQAGDAHSGIRTAHLEKPDLILLDWMMPEVDGLDALRQLKSLEMVAGKRSTCSSGRRVVSRLTPRYFSISCSVPR